MWRAFGMCAGIAFTAACGLSNEYAGPTGGGIGVSGAGGGSGVASTGGTGGSAGLSGGQTGSTGGNGGNGGVNGVNGTTNGFSGTSNGNGPGGNGPGGNGPGGTAAASTGGFMGTSGGSSGGGGTNGGGACTPEFDRCDPTNSNCCAGLSCVNDAVEGRSLCEGTSCQQTSDCPNPVSICSGGTCVLNGCGGSSSNGTFDGTCNAEGQGDGTCVPEAGGKYGLCYQSGSAGSTCDPDATRSDPTDLCSGGMYCAPDVAIGGPGYSCDELCDPGFGNGGKEHCAAAGYMGGCLPIDPPLGLCF
jgi:hypothetical protein